VLFRSAPVVGLIAHGGLGGAIVEASAAILIVAIGIAVWLANRRESDE
jgi:hypothetical protein